MRYIAIREYFIGLDLARARDYSAFAVIALTEENHGPFDRVTYSQPTRPVLYLGSLKRVPLGTEYLEVVKKLRRLVDRSPVVPLFAWRQTPVEPVALDDVTEALAQAATDPSLDGRSFDITGAERLSLGAMVHVLGRARGRHRNVQIARCRNQIVAGRVVGGREEIVRKSRGRTCHARAGALIGHAPGGEPDTPRYGHFAGEA